MIQSIAGGIVVHLGLDSSKFIAGLTVAETKMMAASKKMAAVGTKMMLKVTAPIVGLGAAAVKSFGSFDDAMTKSLAIMGNVSSDMRKQMEDTARTISAETTISAKNLAESYFYLASAGMSAEQSMASLEHVAKFAQAGAFDMAKATDLLTDALTALGMASEDPIKNTENLIKLSDVLVGANTLANASVEQFSEALTNKAAAALRGLNKDVEEGVAVLAAFADQGTKGVEAGEKLFIVYRDMQRAATRSAEVWDMLGISVFDTEGQMRKMWDIIEDLEGVFGKLSDAQKSAAVEMLGFQSRSFAAIQQLLGMSDVMREYYQRLNDMGGITDEVAKKQLESFNAQMKLMWHRIVLSAQSIGASLAPAVLRITAYITALVEKWKGLSEEQQRSVIRWAAVAAAIGPVLFLGSKVIALIVGISGFVKIITLGSIAVVLFSKKIILGAIPALLTFHTTVIKAASALWAKMIPALGGMLPVIAVIAAALAGLNFGSWLNEEFKIVGDLANWWATEMLKSWDRWIFALRGGVAVVSWAWNQIVSVFRVSVGQIQELLGLALEGLAVLSMELGQKKLGMELFQISSRLNVMGKHAQATGEQGKRAFGDLGLELNKLNDELEENLAKWDGVHTLMSAEQRAKFEGKERGNIFESYWNHTVKNFEWVVDESEKLLDSLWNGVKDFGAGLVDTVSKTLGDLFAIPEAANILAATAVGGMEAFEAGLTKKAEEEFYKDHFHATGLDYFPPIGDEMDKQSEQFKTAVDKIMVEYNRLREARLLEISGVDKLIEAEREQQRQLLLTGVELEKHQAVLRATEQAYANAVAVANELNLEEDMREQFIESIMKKTREYAGLLEEEVEKRYYLRKLVDEKLQAEREYYDFVNRSVRTITDSMTDWIINLRDIIDGTFDWKKSLEDLSKTLARMVIQYMIMEPLVKSVTSMITGEGTTSAQVAAAQASAVSASAGAAAAAASAATAAGSAAAAAASAATAAALVAAQAAAQAGGSIVGSAKGNIFSGGKVMPFAKGGVINSPISFGLRDGWGIAGEGGRPEAILPLERGEDGVLGVRAQGGSSVHQVINLNINGVDNPNEFRRSEKQMMRKFELATRRAME